MKFKLIYLITFLVLSFLTLTSYSQNIFEVYENKGEDVKIEAIEKNGQILFKKTETGKIIINSEDEIDNIIPLIKQSVKLNKKKR